MKVFIQRKPRGEDAPWVTVARVSKGNRGLRIARKEADKLRREFPQFVFRCEHRHPLFAPKNSPFEDQETRQRVIDLCRKSLSQATRHP